MRAAVIREPQKALVMEDRPKPKPGQGQVVIKIKACGVCHSDLFVQQHAFGFEQYPVVPGHEVAGVVDEVGPGVNWPAVGDRVGMPWLYSSCGHCKYCVSGNEILCREGQVTGVTIDGGYAEYMLAPAAFVAPIPDALDFADAAPLMCAGLTVYNGLRNAKYAVGQKVAVIGMGGLGHLAILFAKAMAGRVAVISTSSDKEKEARAMGAEKFINAKEEDVVEALRGWDGGPDIILATAPNVASMTKAFPGLAADGTMVVLGADAGAIQVTPMDLISGRRKLLGSPSGGRSDIRATLEFAAAHGVRPVITKFPLERANDVLESMHNGTLRNRAVLMME